MTTATFTTTNFTEPCGTSSHSFYKFNESTIYCRKCGTFRKSVVTPPYTPPYTPITPNVPWTWPTTQRPYVVWNTSPNTVTAKNSDQYTVTT